MPTAPNIKDVITADARRVLDHKLRPGAVWLTSSFCASQKVIVRIVIAITATMNATTNNGIFSVPAPPAQAKVAPGNRADSKKKWRNGGAPTLCLVAAHENFAEKAGMEGRAAKYVTRPMNFLKS